MDCVVSDCRGVANYDTALADRNGITAVAGAQGAKINYSGLLGPRKRPGVRDLTSGVAVPDHYSGVADRQGLAEATAQGAEVDHPAGQSPREWTRPSVLVGVARSHDEASLVHGVGEGVATERSEIDHPARPRPRKAVGGKGRWSSS